MIQKLENWVKPSRALAFAEPGSCGSYRKEYVKRTHFQCPPQHMTKPWTSSSSSSANFLTQTQSRFLTPQISSRKLITLAKALLFFSKRFLFWFLHFWLLIVDPISHVSCTLASDSEPLFVDLHTLRFFFLVGIALDPPCRQYRQRWCSRLRRRIECHEFRWSPQRHPCLLCRSRILRSLVSYSEFSINHSFPRSIFSLVWSVHFFTVTGD